jgi:hypothetical protein
VPQVECILRIGFLKLDFKVEGASFSCVITAPAGMAFSVYEVEPHEADEFQLTYW